MTHSHNATLTAGTHYSPAGTHYRVQGEGHPVVLIHGVGLSQIMWGGQCAGLTPDYQVITYDMLGHGESPNPVPGTGLEAYADQLHELLEHLALKTATVIGFSMGGLVARAFALRYPERLNGLVIMNSVFGRSDAQRSAIQARIQEVSAKGPEANVDAALKRWFSEEYTAASYAQISEIRRMVVGNDHAGYLHSYSLFANEDNYQAARMAEIRVPTLVMTGENDPGSTPDMAREMAALLPDARALILPGERHMMPMESPKPVNQALLAFLQQLHSPCDLKTELKEAQS